jgi:hypothetical protein
MARHTDLLRLPDDVLEDMLLKIRNGAYPYQAALSVGIPKSTFYDWLRRGRAGEKPFAEFSDKVALAHSHARVFKEIKVATENPLAWLRYGPGRERPDEPGWTDSTTIEMSGELTVNVDLEKVRQRLEALKQKRLEEQGG